MINQNTYNDDIKNFRKISSTESEEILATKNLVVIYIGRESCPFCRKFAKKLATLANLIETTIYYVDSSDISDYGIVNFRAKHAIRTVPGYIVSKNGDIKVVCDSSLPEDEILAMLK